MKRKKCAAAVFLSLTVWAGSVCAMEAGEQKVLRYVNYYPVDFRNLDAVHMFENTEVTIAYHVLEGLMRIYQYKLQYGMADSYDISTDGCTYTFHIREDACYSDGAPVCAEDFVRTFRRLVEETYESEYVRLLKNAQEIMEGHKEIGELGVTAVDEQTLRIELEHAQPQFLRYLVMPECSPMRADALGSLRAEDCCGPFYLSETGDETVCRLEKNPYYWERDRIKLDAIEAVYFSDTGAAVSAFKKGKLHVIPLATEEPYDGIEGVYRRVMTGTSDDIYFDLEKDGPLQSKALRLALNYALDREEYCACLENGLIEPNARYVPSIGEGLCEQYVEMNPNTMFPLDGDEKRAQEYLEAALEELGLSSPSEISLPFTVHNDFWSKKEASAAAGQWEEKLGIEIVFHYVSGQTFKEYEGCGGMFLHGSGVDYSDPGQYLAAWAYDYAPKDDSCQSGLFQEYLKQADSQQDQEIRFNTLYEAEKILLEDAPMVPLQLRFEMLLLSPGLTGFGTSADYSGGQYEFLYADLG